MWPFRKKLQTFYDHEKATLARNLDEAEIRHLEVLRREIANLIIKINPDLMIACYDKAAQFERDIVQSPSRAAAEEAALVAKIPMFSDFDLLGTRHFVPYGDNPMYSDDDVIERYHDISHMLIFMKNRSELESVRKWLIHSEEEREVLHRCMQTEKDRLLRRRIEIAIGRYYAYRAGRDDNGENSSAFCSFEDAEVSIVHLPDYASIKYGLAFKNPVEYGVYSSHTFDDGRTSYYFDRSDAHFKERHSLAF